jgi:pyruvate,water dikinase
MRRAVLAAGRRLAEEGRIEMPEHMVDATVDEMCALLSGGQEPTAEELAAHAEYRATHTAKEAPELIGEEPTPPPDPSGLPPAAARVMQAMGIVMGEMLGSSEEQQKSTCCAALLQAVGPMRDWPA